MIEGKIKAIAKKPWLSREVSVNFEANNSLWELNDFHASRGGSPTIVGVVTLQDVPHKSRNVPRYKLQFPDGFVDYARIDNFHEFYDMGFEEQEE